MKIILDSQNRLNKFFRRIRLDLGRSVHSLKTAIACVLGLLLARYFHWEFGQWVPITVIVVMSAQEYFGGTLAKAYTRFLGTVSGVAVAIFTLSLFANNELATIVLIFLSCLFFSYIASRGDNYSYAGVLGGVTVVLTLTIANPSVYHALQRGFYIVIGIIIALLVSRFLLPIHAREKLLFSVGKTLRDLKNFYQVIIHQHPQSSPKSEKLRAAIWQEISLQPELIYEASGGSRHFSQHRKSLFNEIVSIERKILHLMDMLYDYFEKKEIQVFAKQVLLEKEFDHALMKNLEKMAKTIEKEKNNVEYLSLSEIIAKILGHVENSNSQEQLMTVYSFVFLLNKIALETEKLASLISKADGKNN
jgi:uncharacterized membrane protein YgaE (UPF0421/DUF939 family)